MKHEFHIGITTFGDLVYRGKVVDDLNTRSPNLRKRIRVQCKCGTPAFTIPLYYVVRKGNPKQHCGCKDKTIKTIHNREYRIWLMMHERTENPTHVSFKHYGGRGIKVCAEWHKDNPDGKGFERFLTFIGPAPSTNHTIDRVNNDLGYQPFQTDGKTPQVRWATAKEQRANQRPKS